MDYIVLSWFSDTIATNFIKIVMSAWTITWTVWLALENQFIGNREIWAFYPDVEFRNFSQRNLHITNYCCQLKGMANGLRDLVRHVQDHTPVLILIYGVDEKFMLIGVYMQRARPFWSFLDTWVDLLLQELSILKYSSMLPLHYQAIAFLQRI